MIDGMILLKKHIEIKRYLYSKETKWTDWQQNIKHTRSFHEFLQRIIFCDTNEKCNTSTSPHKSVTRRVIAAPKFKLNFSKSKIENTAKPSEKNSRKNIEAKRKKKRKWHASFFVKPNKTTPPTQGLFGAWRFFRNIVFGAFGGRTRFFRALFEYISLFRFGVFVRLPSSNYLYVERDAVCPRQGVCLAFLQACITMEGRFRDDASSAAFFRIFYLFFSSFNWRASLFRSIHIVCGKLRFVLDVSRPVTRVKRAAENIHLNDST